MSSNDFQATLLKTQVDNLRQLKAYFFRSRANQVNVFATPPCAQQYWLSGRISLHPCSVSNLGCGRSHSFTLWKSPTRRLSLQRVWQVSQLCRLTSRTNSCRWMALKIPEHSQYSGNQEGKPWDRSMRYRCPLTLVQGSCSSCFVGRTSNFRRFPYKQRTWHCRCFHQQKYILLQTSLNATASKKGCGRNRSLLNRCCPPNPRLRYSSALQCTVLLRRRRFLQQSHPLVME